MKQGFERIGRDLSADAANRMCIDKKQFRTRNEARDFTLRGAKLFPSNKQMDIYRCAICGGFHLTSLSKASGAAARRRNWSKT